MPLHMPQDAGHAFCQCAMTYNAPMSLFFIFRRNINDWQYYYYYYQSSKAQRCIQN